MEQNVFQNIERQIDGLANDEEEQRFILQSAERKLKDFLTRGRYLPERHGVAVGQAAKTDEKLAEQLELALDTFPFLESWTLGEFASFMEAHAEFIKQKTQKKRGRPRKTEDDVAKQKQKYSQQIAACFKGLRFNAMTNTYQYLAIHPKTGKMYFYSTQGDDLQLLSTKLSLEHGINIPADDATKIFKYLALENRYYPQVEMLNQARARFSEMTLAEAKKLMSNMGEVMFGVFSDEPKLNHRSLRNEVFERFFTAMAHLARNPGEVPFWMPLIIGGQGCGKSAFCNFIIPRGEFEDLSAEIKTSIQKLNDEAYRLHIAYLLEFPEIDAQMNPKTVEWMKNLVTTSEDICRRPYSPEPVRMVRQFGMIGTTNREELFVDATGERRYLPIQIPMGHEVPWKKLEETDLAWKIWAAADILAQNFNDDPVKLRAWTKEELSIISQFQGRFTQTDLWETKVLNFTRIAEGRRFTTPQLLDAIGVDTSRMSSTQANRRVNDIIIKHFGEQAKKVQIYLKDGRRVRGWEIMQSGGGDINVSDSPETLDNIQVNNFDTDF